MALEGSDRGSAAERRESAVAAGLRRVGHVIGLLLLSMAALMLAPALIDASLGNPDWRAFIAASIISALVGAALALGCQTSAQSPVTTQQAFLITVGAWVLLPFFGALPFIFGVPDAGYINALFESVSGMTTTGSTIFVGIEYLAPGLLLWRALLQWIGGLGIVLFALVFLPTLRIGGMQLFKTDSVDSDRSLLVKAREIAPMVLAVYVGLTLLCAVLYRAFGMAVFDAICHAMSTIATGGFSTRDTSFAGADAATKLTCIVFMLIASLPFLRYVEMVTAKLYRIHTDPQVKAFFYTVLFAWLIITAARLSSAPELTFMDVGLDTAFNTVSILTGSGFASANYNTWGETFWILFILLMLVGGCAGSTTCSVKIFRYQVLALVAWGELQRMRRPNRVVVLRFAGKPLGSDVAASVLTFFFLFMISLIVFSIAMSLTGEDLITSISGAATALTNVGPGLGPKIGPVGSFSSVNDAGKIVLIVAMVVGRLELLSVYILFSPGFWRR